MSHACQLAERTVQGCGLLEPAGRFLVTARMHIDRAKVAQRTGLTDPVLGLNRQRQGLLEADFASRTQDTPGLPRQIPGLLQQGLQFLIPQLTVAVLRAPWTILEISAAAAVVTTLELQ